MGVTPTRSRCLALRIANAGGFRKIFAEAAKWFFKAADQGVAEAEGYLGLMYQLGQGVPPSHLWVNIAASRAASYPKG